MNMQILDVLCKGEENAITAKEIAKLFNCETRAVTQEIHRLRKSGEVILSSNNGMHNGFFLPSGRDEVERFCRSMHSRMKNIKIATLSAEKYLSEERRE